MCFIENDTPTSGSLPELSEIAEEWDANVLQRSGELEEGIDITFSNIVSPLICNLIKKHSNGTNVIDVGCGLAYLSNEISMIGYDVTGVDISKKSIEYGRKKFNNIKLYNSSIIDFSQQKHSAFNICVANMVFHNIVDIERNLNAINKIISSSGLLVVSIPHPCFWIQSRKNMIDIDLSYSNESAFKVRFKIKKGAIHNSPITYIHRPIEFYFNLLKYNGFSINEIVEPEEDGSRYGADLLFFACTKNDCLGENRATVSYP
jgi:2-polyprenyl-3-methyl-5-hydroxy-6-metoxy-1,4-benzoquinol methylase